MGLSGFNGSVATKCVSLNCRFSGNVRNSTQKLNHDKYWCKCKEFVDRRSFEKGCMWNPSTSDYQCHKTCCIG